MRQPSSPVLCLAGIAALILAACSSTPTPTPAPSQTPTPAPTPSPTPLPPDTLSVGLLGLGIGTFDLAAIPVASLKNEAKFHGALGVKVHFVTHRNGRTLGSLDSVAVNLGPGETLAVTGDCTDACNGATERRRDRDRRLVGDGHRADLRDSLGRLQLRAMPAGHGYGNVVATLTPSASLSSGAAVVGFAVCENKAGAILGGGSEQFVWQSGSTLSANVPVVLNAAPSSCALGASTGW